MSSETAQDLLAMIEEADPKDTDTLDEIDARFWCWLGVQGFASGRERIDLSFDMLSKIPDGYAYINNFNNRKLAPKYTRSRDELKAIRPERWVVVIKEIIKRGGWVCSLRHLNTLYLVNNLAAATEELAELHAIIQAIDYERKKQ